MRYASVCDGIGAAHVAWNPLGWSCAWTSEIERFPIAVVEQRWGLINLGDMLKITEADIEKHGRFDLLVGGTPCQSFSVAGLRGGLDDPRGNLALRFCQLAGIARPRWVVWENVPGVLSSGKGEDFGSIIRGLEELGYGVAWRSLDAQYFGLAQRRERVFAVGYLGDWRPACAVLLEPESMRGDSAPGREAGEGTAGRVTSGIGGGRGGVDDNDARAMHVVACPEISPALKRRDFKGPSSDGDGDGAPLIAHALTASGHDASEDGTGRGTPLVPVAVDYTNCRLGTVCGTLEAAQNKGNRGHGVLAFDTTQITSKGNYSNPKPGAPCHPLAHGEDAPAIAFAQNQAGEVRWGEVFNTLNTNSNASGRNTPMLKIGLAVRRLTPRECERLMGYPDDYTLIQYRGKPAADGPRYAALGNSMAVPVMRWIGARINTIDKFILHTTERTTA